MARAELRAAAATAESVLESFPDDHSPPPRPTSPADFLRTAEDHVREGRFLMERAAGMAPGGRGSAVREATREAKRAIGGALRAVDAGADLAEIKRAERIAANAEDIAEQARGCLNQGG